MGQKGNNVGKQGNPCCDAARCSLKKDNRVCFATDTEEVAEELVCITSFNTAYVYINNLKFLVDTGASNSIPADY